MLSSPMAQSVLRCSPENMPIWDLSWVQPSSVWAEMMLWWAVLAPSMMSISPPLGQSEP